MQGTRYLIPVRDRSSSVRGVVLAAVLLVTSGCSIRDGTTPPDPISYLWGSRDFDGEVVAGGSAEVVAMLNDAAASGEMPSRPLTVRLSAFIPKETVFSARTTTVSLVAENGFPLRLERVPGVGPRFIEYLLEWTPSRCFGACVRTAPLIVDDPEGLPPGTRFTLSGEIVYRPREDSVPTGAGLVIGLRSHPGSHLFTSIGSLDKPGVLLISGSPRAHQRFQLRVPRSELDEDVAPGATSELVWAGGAVRALAARPGSAARVILTTGNAGPMTVTLDRTSRLREGIIDAAFEVPFQVRCSEHICTADLDTTFELVEGPWILVNPSNKVPGIVTLEGHRVPGARLRAVES